ncbi:MAG: glycosyltransferase family 4 protein [Patescibacteria group bacterium]|nr:glycosyltransferase family 4 protein [Patescibacteria group bacterium]
MKIIQANKFYYLKGGAERYYFNLIKLLESKGHEVIPFAMHDEKNYSSKYSKYFVSNVDFEKSGHNLKKAWRVLYSFEAKKKFEQLIKDTNPDIIHIHNIYHQISPSILTVAKKHKIPVVETLHDFKLICPNYTLYSKKELCEQCKKYRYYKCTFRKCIKNKFWQSALASKEMYFHKLIRIYENNVNLFLAPSKFVYNKILEFGIITAEQITILPEFVYTKNNNLQQQNQENYVLYFGRLIKEKGIKTLISAMKKVNNLELHIAGSGPDEQEFKDLVKKENLNNIKFLGFLDQEKLKQEIRNSLFVIHPSEVYETFGLSILENYALAKTVIASNLGALPEIVKDKQTGLLFKAGDSDDLTDKINYLANNQNLVIKMGDNAKKIVEQKYSSEVHYQQLIKIYEELK